jgi:hypothetical protein
MNWADFQYAAETTELALDDALQAAIAEVGELLGPTGVWASAGAGAMRVRDYERDWN